jgi:hypothetical protein
MIQKKRNFLFKSIIFICKAFISGGVEVRLVTGILSLLFFLSVSLSANAIALVNKDIIMEAQEYGKKQSQLPLTDFLHPWLVYEEQATVINEMTERAYLYTPFLLLAYDARDKARSKQQVEFAASEKILSDYAGCLAFSIIINGKEENFSDKVQVVIKQDNKIIKPYHAVTNPAVKIPGSPNEAQYTAHFYYYFYDREVAMGKPVTLSVITKDKQERKFYFELSKFK